VPGATEQASRPVPLRLQVQLMSHPLPPGPTVEDGRMGFFRCKRDMVGSSPVMHHHADGVSHLRRLLTHA